MALDVAELHDDEPQGHVARFLLAGASAVEMTSAVLTDGPAALARAVEELASYLDRQGRGASDIVGEAADHTATYAARTEERLR